MRKLEPSEENALFELLNYNVKARSKGLCYVNDSINLKLLWTPLGKNMYYCVIALNICVMKKFTNHKIIGCNPDSYFQTYFLKLISWI